MSTNEPSGNHTLPPREPDEGSATFKLPRSTLVVVIAALIGSGGTGSVMTLLRGNENHAEEVTKAVDAAVVSLRADIAGARAEVSEVNKAVGEVQKTLTVDAEVHRHMADELADHEKRLRDIERRLR